MHAGATCGFQETGYTVSEGAGTVIVCVTYDGEIPCGQTATITEDGSATGTYIWNTARCSSVSIIDIFMQSTNAIWNIVVLTMFHVPFQNSVPGSVLLMTLCQKVQKQVM